MNEVSHLATDKDIVTMLTTIIGAICLVIGGTIGFFTKYFYENKKINESKKALRQQMITNNIAPMRQTWINEVRNKVSEFNHQAKMIRSKIYTNFGMGNKHSEEELTRLNNEISNDFYRLNELSEILDLLLPFNIDSENRKEEVAESLRKNINDTIDYCTKMLLLISKNEKRV